jgi:hypothetical protein
VQILSNRRPPRLGLKADSSLQRWPQREDARSRREIENATKIVEWPCGKQSIIDVSNRDCAILAQLSASMTNAISGVKRSMNRQ